MNLIVFIFERKESKMIRTKKIEKKKKIIQFLIQLNLSILDAIGIHIETNSHNISLIGRKLSFNYNSFDDIEARCLLLEGFDKSIRE